MIFYRIAVTYYKINDCNRAMMCLYKLCTEEFEANKQIT